MINYDELFIDILVCTKRTKVWPFIWFLFYFSHR